MYKCGWNGCEKAYGTLNHLNAHVTMQSHGSKRTPEGMSTASQYLRIASLGAVVNPSPFPANDCLLIFSPSRVQGDSQGVEGTQEGRRYPTQGC